MALCFLSRDASHNVVLAAQREALGLQAALIRTEHLLLALAIRGSEPCTTGISPILPRPEQLRSVMRSSRDIADGNASGFSDRSKRALFASSKVALKNGRTTVEAEDILVSLLEDPESGAVLTLHACGVDCILQGRVEDGSRALMRSASVAIEVIRSVQEIAHECNDDKGVEALGSAVAILRDMLFRQSGLLDSP